MGMPTRSNSMMPPCARNNYYFVCAGNPEGLLNALREADADGSGTLNVDQLEAALAAANIPLIKHLVIALHRALQLPADEGKCLAIEDLVRLFGLKQ